MLKRAQTRRGLGQASDDLKKSAAKLTLLMKELRDRPQLAKQVRVPRRQGEALSYARAAGFFLIPRPESDMGGVRVIADRAFLEFTPRATAAEIRAVVDRQLELERKAKPRKGEHALKRGSSALLYARAAGFWLLRLENAQGASLRDGVVLEFGSRATAKQVRELVDAQLKAEGRTHPFMEG